MCEAGVKAEGCKLALIGLATMANEYYHWLSWPMFIGAVLLAVGAYKWFFGEEERAPEKPKRKRRR